MLPQPIVSDSLTPINLTVKTKETVNGKSIRTFNPLD